MEQFAKEYYKNELPKMKERETELIDELGDEGVKMRMRYLKVEIEKGLKRNQDDLDLIKKKESPSWIIEMTKKHRETRKQKVARLINELEALEGGKQQEGISNSDIIKSKEYPINHLIEFNYANFANCINHEEKTPSMKYYPSTNSIYCFGCGWSGDSIEVAKKLWNLSFKQVIQKLCG